MVWKVMAAKGFLWDFLLSLLRVCLHLLENFVQWNILYSVKVFGCTNWIKILHFCAAQALRQKYKTQTVQKHGNNDGTKVQNLILLMLKETN